MQLEVTIRDIVHRRLNQETGEWISSKAAAIKGESRGAVLYQAFAAVPRQTGKEPVHIIPEEQAQIDSGSPGFDIQDWPIDRLCRVWLLMQPDRADRNAYCSKIESLFPAAEMNEQVALYSALPVLAYPESWSRRCSEGIRSNIGPVLEAIMIRNPYPAAYLDEPAWNQLVLKAFFTDKKVQEIIGIAERANQALASTLLDYARERHAAFRSIDPFIWTLIGKFMDAGSYAAIKESFEQGSALKKD